MLSHEDNELVTRVGPGTMMGDLMRQYWMPALMSSELPVNDSDPVRVMLLGEQLVAFRDTHGRVGLLRHACPHRRAPLFLGRVEEDGLRCVFHGWKFDVTGACVDMPNEPPESDFKHKIKPAGYRCAEYGGMVWAYMGPRAEPPPLPSFEQFDAADSDRYLRPVQVEANWLQVVEGDLDTVHLSFLHAGHVGADDVQQGTYLEYSVRNRALRYKIVDTDFGYTSGAYRPACDEDHLYWRIAHFLFPFYVMTPTGVLGLSKNVLFSVPMDDTHTMKYSISVRPAGAPSGQTGYMRGNKRIGLVPDSTKHLPNTKDWFGRWRWSKNKSNDYLIDRDRQRRGDTYTGIEGFSTEDRAMNELMGTILDRTDEHLGSTDMGIIRLRRRLIAAAKALAARGVTPPGVDEPKVYQQRSGGVVLHKDQDWLEATKDLMATGVDHPELDGTVASGA